MSKFHTIESSSATMQTKEPKGVYKGLIDAIAFYRVHTKLQSLKYQANGKHNIEYLVLVSKHYITDSTLISKLASLSSTF